jgi:hypothetical protein
MGAAKKGPAQTEETREGRFFKQVKEESTYFRDAQWNHHGQASPRCRLNAFSVLEGSHRFFSSSSPIWGISI